MNLLLLGAEDETAPGVFRVTGRRAEHIRAVLRARPGARLRAGRFDGKIGEATVLVCDRNRAEVVCPVFNLDPPKKIPLVPIVSLPRPQSFKKVLRFIAAAGIAKAFFVGSKRVEKSYWTSCALQPETVREELTLGLEQGADTVLPLLAFYPSLRAFFCAEESFLASCARRLVAHPAPDAPNCPHAAAACGATLALGIGPEGGYTPGEATAFQQHGFKLVSLGPHILRVEFALAVLCGRLIP